MYDFTPECYRLFKNITQIVNGITSNQRLVTLVQYLQSTYVYFFFYLQGELLLDSSTRRTIKT